MVTQQIFFRFIQQKRTLSKSICGEEKCAKQSFYPLSIKYTPYQELIEYYAKYLRIKVENFNNDEKVIFKYFGIDNPSILVAH
jgi:hypothetical protein